MVEASLNILRKQTYILFIRYLFCQERFLKNRSNKQDQKKQQFITYYKRHLSYHVVSYTVAFDFPVTNKSYYNTSWHNYDDVLFIDIMLESSVTDSIVCFCYSGQTALARYRTVE